MPRFPIAQAALLAVLLVAGCATDQAAAPGGEPAPAAGAARTPTAATGVPDIAQECTVHHRLMAGKSRAEQQATMQSQMQAMSGRNVTSDQVRAERDRLDKACGAAASTR